MKITSAHYEHMKAAIAALPVEGMRTHKQMLASDNRVKDLEKRFRWDLSYAAKLTPFICSDVYSYANDEHVDTALRQIVCELAI